MWLGKDFTLFFIIITSIVKIQDLSAAAAADSTACNQSYPATDRA